MAAKAGSMSAESRRQPVVSMTIYKQTLILLGLQPAARVYKHNEARWVIERLGRRDEDEFEVC